MPPLLPSSLPCFRPCVLPSLLAGSFTTPRWVLSRGAACWLRQRFTSPSHTRSGYSTSWARSNWCGMAASYTTRCATLTVRSSLPTARSNTYPLTVPLAVAACSTLSGAPHPLCRPSGAYYTLHFTILKEPTILDYRSLLYFDYTNSILTVAAPSTIRRRSQLRMAPRSATSCGLGVVRGR